MPYLELMSALWAHRHALPSTSAARPWQRPPQLARHPLSLAGGVLTKWLVMRGQRQRAGCWVLASSKLRVWWRTRYGHKGEGAWGKGRCSPSAMALLWGGGHQRLLRCTSSFPMPGRPSLAIGVAERLLRRPRPGQEWSPRTGDGLSAGLSLADHNKAKGAQEQGRPSSPTSLAPPL